MSIGTERNIGRVLSVSGSEARIGVVAESLRLAGGVDNAALTVGKFIGIVRNRSLLVAIISQVSTEVPLLIREEGYHAVANVDLMGEIITGELAGAPHFLRGVTTYPAIGDIVVLLGTPELRMIYNVDKSAGVELGCLQQDTVVKAYANIHDMISKHFAILGTTGVGKSSGLASLLRQMLAVCPEQRIFLLDGHNEYGNCFGDRALVVNPANLKLPFWLFTFEELLEIIFSGRPGDDEEVEILAELVPIAKSFYQQQSREASTTRRSGDVRPMDYSIDTPVPYRLKDLLALIDERMGKLENRSSRINHRRLITRIEAVANDPRYAFMFANANVGGDTMAEILRHLFRWRPEGKPMTVMQLAGIPSEVVDAVVSVLCRMAFDFGLWSNGAIPLLFICEEAHRYVSADRSLGFQPTRRALSRIAKEGRKYKVFLGLITQRPAEIDANIVSQCSTLFAMRIANDRDQQLLLAAASDAATNLLRFLPSLGPREALAFGAGIPMPTLFTFPELPADCIPRVEAASIEYSQANVNEQIINSAIERWRGSMTAKRVLEGAR
ncbi:MAG: ATP-binding protein [Xanthobacteraceae bacterium]